MPTRWRSEWLDWQPSQDSFVGFEGSLPSESSIIQTLEEVETSSARPSKGRVIEKAGRTRPSKPSKPAAEKIPSMPPGLRLLEWNPKPAPVLLTYMAVVTDVPQFIGASLAQLGAALYSEQGPATHREVREQLDRLEQCGVVVRVRSHDSITGSENRWQGADVCEL
jgi:hypothetical protein